EQRGDEHHAVGNVLGRIGEVLAAIALAVSEPVGENKCFAILLERLDVTSRRRMDRHREITKFHAFLRGGEEGRRRILVLGGLSHKRPSALGGGGGSPPHSCLVGAVAQEPVRAGGGSWLPLSRRDQ